MCEIAASIESLPRKLLKWSLNCILFDLGVARLQSSSPNQPTEYVEFTFPSHSHFELFSVSELL